MASSPRTDKLLHELDVIDQREDVILNALVDRGSKLQAVVDETQRRSRTVTVDDLGVINDALGAVAQATVDLQARIERAQTATSTDATGTTAPSFDQLAASIREHSAEADALRTTLRARLTVLDPPGPEGDDEPGPEVPRTFVLKKKPMTGSDIKGFQHELNARFAKWKIGIRIREDGQYGQQTRLAALRAARGLGLDAEMEHGVTPRLRSLMRDPRRRTPEHRARAAEMRPWLIRLRKSHPLRAQHSNGSGSSASPRAGGRSELAAAIRANGGHYEDLVIAEAERVKLPVSLVCAVLDTESDFTNVFGHDEKTSNPIKSPPNGTLTVTEKLYKEYRRHRVAGKGNQGVGPMQLTATFLQDEADKRGGCWMPDVNIRVGVEHLADRIKARKSTRLGLRDYNGSIEYADAVLKLKATWDRRLAGASAKPPKPVKPDGPVKLGQRPTFRVKRTPMKGKNVAAFQRALNHRYAIWKIGRRVEVDGVYGPNTADAAREVLRGLGVHRDDYAGGITPELRILIRTPKNRRTPQQLRRAALRRPWLLKLRKRYAAGASGGVVRPLETRAGGNSEFHVADGEGAPANSGKKFHAGKDWFAPGGSAVKAPVAGKIVEAKPSNNNGGQVFGGTVKIQAADGKVWVFRHVVPKVSVGERVTAGDRVASVTKWTGGSSHAHIEIWKTFNGGYDLENMVDPMTYFKKWA